MEGVWVPHDTRDQIVDYMKYWSERAEQPVGQLLNWLGLASSKYDTWKHRYGKANEHNGKIPRDWWIEAWEIPLNQDTGTQLTAVFRCITLTSVVRTRRDSQPRSTVTARVRCICPLRSRLLEILPKPVPQQPSLLRAACVPLKRID
jgi:hypothetical protein